jgi:hypothetical protein
MAKSKAEARRRARKNRVKDDNRPMLKIMKVEATEAARQAIPVKSMASRKDRREIILSSGKIGSAAGRKTSVSRNMDINALRTLKSPSQKGAGE